MRKLATLTTAALAMAAFIGNPAHAAEVNLSGWSAESYPSVSGFPAGAWVLAPDNLSVTQQNNGQPTFFVSDFNAIGTAVEGTIEVLTTDDDDFIGFALGILPGDSTNSGADYLLIDWKQGTQSFNFGAPSCTPESTAPRGLAVSRVTGIPTADEFWGHTDFNTAACSPLGDGLTELQRGATQGATGWADNTEYTFRFEFTATSLKVFVDGTKEIDIAGVFFDGRLAFYNFSQNLVKYSGFEVTPLALDIDIKPQSFPNGMNICGGGVVPLAFIGSVLFDPNDFEVLNVLVGSISVGVIGKGNRDTCVIEDVTGDFPDGGVQTEAEPGGPDLFDDLVCQVPTVDLRASGELDTSDVKETAATLEVCVSLDTIPGDTVEDFLLCGTDTVWLTKNCFD